MVDDNNSLRDITGADCSALAQSLCCYFTFHYALDLITVYVAVTVSPAGWRYARSVQYVPGQTDHNYANDN